MAVPKDKLGGDEAMARRRREVWKDYGALAYVACSVDDMPYGELKSFPRAVQGKESQTVVFAWILTTRGEGRDAIVFADRRMKPALDAMPFDAKRMIYRGYETFVKL